MNVVEEENDGYKKCTTHTTCIVNDWQQATVSKNEARALAHHDGKQDQSTSRPLPETKTRKLTYGTAHATGNRKEKKFIKKETESGRNTKRRRESLSSDNETDKSSTKFHKGHFEKKGDQDSRGQVTRLQICQILGYWILLQMPFSTNPFAYLVLPVPMPIGMDLNSVYNRIWDQDTEDVHSGANDCDSDLSWFHTSFITRLLVLKAYITQSRILGLR